MENKTWDLIHKLDANEKKSFRVWAKKMSGESEYLNLFNDLSKQNEYKPIILQKKYPYLSRINNYLWEVLLDYLSKNADSERQQQLDTLKKIEFLIHKRLFDEALELIQVSEPLFENALELKIVLKIYHYQATLISPSKKMEESIINDIYTTSKDVYMYSKVNYFRFELQEFFNKFIILLKKNNLTELEALYNKYRLC